MNIKLLFASVLVVIVSGCQMPQPQPAPPTTRPVSYQLPVLTPVDPNKQTQEADSIRVTVSPYPYTTRRLVHREIHRIPTVIVVNNQYPADMVEVPRIEVTPNQVCFKVSIVNHLEHVVRMAGTTVSFQVAGKSVAVDKAGYDDFLNGMLLPGQENDYEIKGPDISALPANATIGLFLYDMVTGTDAAGNPNKKSNFEFYYTLSRQQKTVQMPVITKRVMLDQSGRIIGRP